MRFIYAIVAAAALLSAHGVQALKRPLSALFAEHQQQVELARSSRQMRIVGGLLAEHISTKEWNTMDRELVHVDDEVSFSIQLKQCKLDVLKNLVEQVSNPKHENYQNYMTNTEIDDFVHCGEPTDKAKQDIPAWLHSNGIRNEQIHASNAYIHVNKATVSQIERLFDVEMFYHLHKKTNKVVLRARGLLEMPIAISEHVEFISGLTELHSPSKATHVGRKPSQGTAPYLLQNFQDIPITPRVLRRLYNMRMNLTGGSASNNGLAIAAFDDFFYEEDLCYAYDVLGRDPMDGSLYANPPTINYNGPLNGSDDGESALDIEYSTLMAYNVSTSFYNHVPEIWVLSWVQQTINFTDENGPWVWSISYGWPEVGHCQPGDTMDDPTLCSGMGLSYMGYVDATNNELMKLALMGVTVFVSSGDAGSPGFTIYCPVDASKPQSFAGGYDLTTTCPSSNPNDCHCGSFVISYTDNSTGLPNFCILPNLFTGDIVNNQLGGEAACTIFNTGDDPYGQFFSVLQQWFTAMNSTCQSTFDPEYVTFGSTCTCDALPTETFSFVINSTTGESIPVTLSGYVYNNSYAPSMFFSDFPTASPYVVSVGATMIDPFRAGNACGENSVEIFSTILAGSLITGGGGFSVVASRPTWQTNLVEAYLNSSELPPAGSFNASNRGYPDISLNGHNYLTVTNRRLGYVDGTSASSPASAAMFALMNEVLLSHGKKPLGLITPLLYQMAIDEPTAFNKITSATYDSVTYGGDNACTETYCSQYGYKVSTNGGWDPVTGLGTPNMGVIENYIRAMNGLPSIAQEGAAQVTAAPTSAPNTPTNAPTSKGPDGSSPPPPPPSSSSNSTSGAQSASTGTATKTVTTAGAVTIGILCAFFGAVGAFMLTKIKKSSGDDFYKRHSQEGSVQLGKSAI